MKRLVRWLRGAVTLRVTGEGLEELLNLCAQEGIFLERMTRLAEGLELQVLAPRAARLEALLRAGPWQETVVAREGVPYFLRGFRR